MSSAASDLSPLSTPHSAQRGSARSRDLPASGSGGRPESGLPSRGASASAASSRAGSSRGASVPARVGGSAKPRKGSTKGKKKKKKPIIEDLKAVRDLLFACESGNVDAVRLLLNNTFNEGKFDFQSGQAGESITIAAAKGHITVLEYLLQNAAAGSPTASGNAAFHPNPNYQSGRPLQRAALFGQLASVRLLLERGADPNLRSVFHEFSALAFACQAGHSNVAKLLIAAGAKVDAAVQPDRNGVYNGWAPIHFASDGGFDALVQLLLDSGAPVDQPTPADDTALAIAAERGKWECAQLLVNAGAAINAKRRGLNAVQWAVYRADVEVIQYLVSFGGAADLDVRTKWLPNGLTLKELCYQEFSETVFNQIDLAIYRGSLQVRERERKRQLLSEVQWLQAPIVDPYSFEPPPPPIPRSLPTHVINLICEYES